MCINTIHIDFARSLRDALNTIPSCIILSGICVVGSFFAVFSKVDAKLFKVLIKMHRTGFLVFQFFLYGLISVYFAVQISVINAVYKFTMASMLLMGLTTPSVHPAYLKTTLPLVTLGFFYLFIEIVWSFAIGLDLPQVCINQQCF
jgi:hypothetical protein